MKNDENWKISTTLKMFVNGIDTMITVRDDEPPVTQHMTAVATAIDTLKRMGATATESGEPKNEDEEERFCMYYVVCQFSNGRGVKLCSNKYAFTTVFEDHFSDLWFVPNESNIFPGTAFEVDKLLANQATAKFVNKLDEPRYVIRKWHGKFRQVKADDGTVKEMKVYRFERSIKKTNQSDASSSTPNADSEFDVTAFATNTYDRIQALNSLEKAEVAGEFLEKNRNLLGPERYKDLLEALLEKKNELTDMGDF